MLHHLATPLFKRGDPPPELADIPKWLWGLFAADIIVLVPILFFVAYTIGNIFPVLAIVEDEKAPPSYQALSGDPEDAEPESAAAAGALDPALFIVNSSLRRIHKLLRSSGGWRTYFRGVLCVLAIGLATGILQPIITAVLRPLNLHPLATFPTYLSLSQFHTAWVHIVITPRSARHFFQRLPPFKKTVKANLRPVALFAASTIASQNLSPLLAKLFGVTYPIVPWTGKANPDFGTGHFGFLLVLLLLLQAVMFLVLVVPSYVALVRVQASLLPPDQDPIVAFDRSFGGRVDPAVVASEGGRDYATLRDVWETISRAAVRRLVLVMLKIAGVNLALAGVLAAVLGPQIHRVRKAGPGSSIF